MLLALDDTDSPTGGCTTFTALELLHRAGLHLRSMPRLVRLNPNCPHKTRGNGAVVLELAKPEGPRVTIGAWQGRPIEAFPDGGDPDVDPETLWHILGELTQPDASPAMVLTDAPIPPWTYAAAVTTQVTQEAAREALRGAWFLGGQGLVGCAGAVSWPGPASSYEWIAYRDPARWGTPRAVEAGPLLDAPGTFHTNDGTRLTCVPNTPCPVLMGLRGLDPEALLAATPRAAEVASEPIAGWCLWATNQASGDHVVALDAIEDAPPWATIELEATIQNAPEARTGGVAVVQAQDRTGQPVDLVAFEPTGDLRHAVWSLRPGDRVVATGALDGDTIQLEVLRLVDPVPTKVANPTCCERPMKSKGTNAGYRCNQCGKAAPEDAATHAPRKPGAWEAPISARRHLHRPLAW